MFIYLSMALFVNGNKINLKFMILLFIAYLYRFHLKPGLNKLSCYLQKRHLSKILTPVIKGL